MDSSTSSPARQPMLAMNAAAGVEVSNVIPLMASTSAAANPPLFPAALERRRDYQERVRFQCRKSAVPLRLGEDGDVYFLAVKPVIDTIVATLLLLLFSPLFLIIVALIKLHDGGPVFFVQSRTGHLGRRFPLLKFRTMIPGAEAAKAAVNHLNLHNDGSPDFKAEGDPRITPVGRWLRAWSLDELPNLINVVRGELSLVGPRPTSFDVSTYASAHLTRLAVRPGITGLWQVSGRALIGFDRRCELDEAYIRSAGLRTDMAILVRTVGAVVRRQGAL
jgi:lipopolysaccharide/colanic/teichoic acid biosynthesis glycosyltransferase